MSDKVLDRVRKLLALANDAGATEGERDNAVRMAHGLLAKHNLAMADITQHIAMEGREAIELQTFSMQWCRRVGLTVGRLFFCKMFIGKKINGTKVTYHFVGKQSNVITASLMTEYLINSILKEARSRFGHNLAPESRAFGVGAAERLSGRVRKMMDTGGENLEPGTGLVVVEMYKTEEIANADFLKSKGIELTKYGKAGQPVNTAAYNAGKKFGDGLSLNDQIAGKNRKLIGA